MHGINKTLREYVLIRDKYTCHYCGRRIPFGRAIYPHQVHMQVDHVIPVSKGGRSVLNNLVACCSDCNQLKKHYTLSPMEARLNVQMLARYEREYIDNEGRTIIIRPPHSQGLGGIMPCRE